MAFDPERFYVQYNNTSFMRFGVVLQACIELINTRGQDLIRSGPIQWPMEGRHREKLLDPEHTRLVMVREGKSSRLVAVAMLRLSWGYRGCIGDIEHVLVDEDFRGLGLGDKLVEALIEQARDAQVYKLQLFSENDGTRTAARALYLKHGFVPVKGSDVHFELRLT